jgi:hypothetical protein
MERPPTKRVERSELEFNPKKLLLFTVLSAILHSGLSDAALGFKYLHEVSYQSTELARAARLKWQKVEAEIRAKLHGETPTPGNTLEQLKQVLLEQMNPHYDVGDFVLQANQTNHGFSEQDTATARRAMSDVAGQAIAMRNGDQSVLCSDEVLNYILQQQGIYRPEQAMMTSVALGDGGNCEARAQYIVSIVEDVCPQLAELGLISMQNFDGWQADGQTHDPHVRVVIDEGRDYLVLEGDAVKREPKLPHDPPIYEAHWYILASYLVGQHALDWSELGYPAATAEDQKTNSYSIAPPSPARYQGSDGTGDIHPSTKPLASEASTSNPDAIHVSILSDSEATQLDSTLAEQYQQERKAAMQSINRRSDSSAITGKGDGPDMLMFSGEVNLTDDLINQLHLDTRRTDFFIDPDQLTSLANVPNPGYWEPSAYTPGKTFWNSVVPDQRVNQVLLSTYELPKREQLMAVTHDLNIKATEPVAWQEFIGVPRREHLAIEFWGEGARTEHIPRLPTNNLELIDQPEAKLPLLDRITIDAFYDRLDIKNLQAKEIQLTGMANVVLLTGDYRVTPQTFSGLDPNLAEIDLEVNSIATDGLHNLEFGQYSYNQYIELRVQQLETASVHHCNPPRIIIDWDAKLQSMAAEAFLESTTQAVVLFVDQDADLSVIDTRAFVGLKSKLIGFSVDVADLSAKDAAARIAAVQTIADQLITEPGTQVVVVKDNQK